MSKLKYYDGTNWKTVNGQIVGDTLPIGAIVPFGGWEAPTGWLICDGRLLNKNAYPELFDTIDYSFGGEEGENTFGLPDLRGRTPIGLNENDTDFDGIGIKIGEKTHTLTTQEMPSHNHKIGISQNVQYASGSSYGLDGGATPSFDTSNTGGGQPHNIMQPSLTVNYIIKAFQSVGVVSEVENTRSESTKNVYSCDYVNGIIESGSNANGDYTKFADGTMICTGIKSGSTSWSDWWGFAKRSPEGNEALSATFSQEFINNNVSLSLTPSHGNDIFSASYLGITTTGFSYICYKPSGVSSTNYEIKYIATGRWK